MWGTEEEKRAFGSLYLLFYGNESQRNYKMAVKTMKKLAGQGYIPAVYMLGDMYDNGKGVRKNKKLAFEYYLEAARAAYPSAECGVGNLYATAFPKHDACEHDSAKAVHWYLSAAGHGNAGAQCNLASQYMSGLGVAHDPVEAYVWASMSMHCSPIRFRSAEVFRDQALGLMDEVSISAVNERISTLQKKLPYIWSVHSVYWESLASQETL